MVIWEARKLKKGDIVVVKRTGVPYKIERVEIIPEAANLMNMECVSLLLDDGKWYVNKEVESLEKSKRRWGY